MNEVLIQPYEDQLQTPSFGQESGEGGGDRVDFNDVDDYENWSASPPENKNGAALIGYDRWTRSVDISFVKPTDLQTEVLSQTGVKRITVTVSRDGIPATQLIAIRTHAWPMSRKDPGIDVLFVVDDTGSLTSQEKAKQLLMKSWGFTVMLIGATESQANLDAATVDANVAYISEDINDSDLDTKLRYTLIGVVNEVANLGSEFGFADSWTDGISSNIQIVDNSHYITSGLSLGTLQILNLSQPVHMLSWPYAPGLQTLGGLQSPISGRVRPATH